MKLIINITTQAGRPLNGFPVHADSQNPSQMPVVSFYEDSVQVSGLDRGSLRYTLTPGDKVVIDVLS